MFHPGGKNPRQFNRNHIFIWEYTWRLAKFARIQGFSMVVYISIMIYPMILCVATVYHSKVNISISCRKISSVKKKNSTWEYSRLIATLLNTCKAKAVNNTDRRRDPVSMKLKSKSIGIPIIHANTTLSGT